MKEQEAAKGLAEFFANGFKPMSFLDATNDMEGFWWHDSHGPRRRLSDDEIDSLLYLLDVYVNGE